MKPHILIAAPMPEHLIDVASRNFQATMFQERSPTAEEIVNLAVERHFDGLLVSARVTLGRAAICGLPPSIRAIATLGAGLDHIDLREAEERGIAVFNTPGPVTEATADMTIMLMLCACRRAREYLDIVEAGWGRRLEPNEMLGRNVSGRRLGIVGMGRIGKAVARRAKGFGLQVLYHSRRQVSDDDALEARYVPDLDEMLAETEILSIHVPATPQTDGLIDARRLALLPRAAVVVNTARGQIIDESALIAALQSGKVAAAGLDVFMHEPNIDPRWLSLPQVFLTPHMGSATVETRSAMFEMAFQGLRSALG